ncbi:odorant receptor 131-2-like [Hoplias malabaricus]|uniref:odorant receptor 131-2-like n=1 Tax=Hoplias malabaricus TaxID=27720 RepID=UPI003461FA23
MNTSRDPFEDAFAKQFIVVGLGVFITYINGIFVFAFFKHSVFYTDPRYILYIHLVINDLIMLFLTVSLYVLAQTVLILNVTVCSVLLLFATTTSEISPLNLAGMAIERYIAICKPLHHTQLCSVNRTHILIGLIWLLNFIPALTDIFILLVNEPISIFSTSVRCNIKSLYGSDQHLMRSIFVESLYLSCVILTLVFTYIKVLQAAKAATSDQASATKARNTILLHGLQLLLCLLAYVAPFVNYFLLDLYPKYRSMILFSTYLLSNILPRLLSPLIYGLRDQKMFIYVRIYLTYSLLLSKTEPNMHKSMFPRQRQKY